MEILGFYMNSKSGKGKNSGKSFFVLEMGDLNGVHYRMFAENPEIAVKADGLKPYDSIVATVHLAHMNDGTWKPILDDFSRKEFKV